MSPQFSHRLFTSATTLMLLVTGMNQVPYWQSPAAMWLVLGLYAFAGCLVAVFLRGWLTRGVQWKSDSAPHV